MDNNFTRTLNNFESLNMPEFRTNIERYIGYVESGEKTMIDALYELTSIQLGKFPLFFSKYSFTDITSSFNTSTGDFPCTLTFGRIVL